MKVTLKDGPSTCDSDSLSFELAAKLGFEELQKKLRVIMEPIMKLEVLTEENMGDIVGDLNRRRGQVNSMDDRAGSKVVKAEVLLCEMFGHVTLGDFPLAVLPQQWNLIITLKPSTFQSL